MKNLIKPKCKNMGGANSFTKEEICFRLYMDDLSIRNGLKLLKKILMLDNDMIYTKAIMTDLILNNNPKIKSCNNTIIKEVYMMQETAKNKVITVINKFYHVDFHKMNETFEQIMLLYVWKLQYKGIDIDEDGCLFLWSVEEQENIPVYQLKESYMDNIVQLCNSYESYEECITKVLEYDEPLYDAIVELVGEEEVRKYVSK